MAIELKIVWEGEVPGLADQHLSIAAFGEALNALLVAYKRIASNMISNAADYAEKGRLQEEARWLDIEIVDLARASAGVQAVCTARGVPGDGIPLFMTDIVRRASGELLDSVKEESLGNLRNSTVRKYLEALPQGLKRQVYELTENGNTIHEPVVIEAIHLAEVPALDLPYLIEFSGSVIAIGFEPGRNEIKIKQEAGQTLTLQASPAQVETGLELRGLLVRGLAVRAKQMRLLRLERKDAPRFEVTPEVVDEQIFRRWEALLEALAQ